MTSHPSFKISPQLMLKGYAAGIFPMSESHKDPKFFWVNPKYRGIIPLNQYHIPRSLKKIIRRGIFKITFNKNFQSVVQLCAKKRPERQNTWINQPIKESVIKLHEMGFAHSIECWKDGTLAGGLYGISLGAAFFGESMFSDFSNASKVALVYLLAQLKMGNYRLLDTQFITDHLTQFGAIEISDNDYLEQLENALKFQSNFHSNPELSALQISISKVLIGSTKLTHLDS